MLTYTDEETKVSISVSFDRYDALQADRTRWAWSIDCAGEVIATGDDLSTVGDPRAADALEALASFLGAWAESVDYGRRTGHEGENADLFPEALRALTVDWERVHFEIRADLGMVDEDD